MILQWAQNRPNFSLQWVGPDFVNTAVSTMEELESIIAVISGPQGPQGPQGPAGSISQYEHTQVAPSDTWIVNHNLGRKIASVLVKSTGGVEVETGVLIVSDNQLQVLFSVPFSGSAIIV